MKYAFIALHSLQFSVQTMYRLLRVHPSGFHIWLKKPLGRRANEDKRQTDLLLRAWEESGKVYGYRKLRLSDEARSILIFAAYHELTSGEPVREVFLDDEAGHKASSKGQDELNEAGPIRIDYAGRN